ncbi:nuclear transport factor 2 family protein [Ruegeria pomeroyi]|uniref:Nuclear transport factor 2 family protein n=1 Tax=Ruegeria pomeroyi TaxID=89184 RepID=A0A9Q3WJC4_9RHOB|nr:tautomerase family protein [Ruegeria pomeroyi]MCE8536994.1 nuclear transport factor 2 family protein [Ruegeria pomeroyi]
MPVVELHLIKGYGEEDKRRLGHALTDAVRFVLPAPLDGVTVMIHEMAPDAYYRGRDTKTPAPALPDPAEVVRAYLSAMEARDLDAARAMQGDGFTMYFPGTGPMTDLAELIDWARARYSFVNKTYEGFDAMPGAGDISVVYCRGTLSGEWPDGTAFSGIRFVDRFELVAGRITRQDVWNDMGEMRGRT